MVFAGFPLYGTAHQVVCLFIQPGRQRNKEPQRVFDEIPENPPVEFSYLSEIKLPGTEGKEHRKAEAYQEIEEADQEYRETGNPECIGIYRKILTIQSQCQVSGGKGNVADIEIKSQEQPNRSGGSQKYPEPEIGDDARPVFGVIF